MKACQNSSRRSRMECIEKAGICVKVNNGENLRCLFDQIVLILFKDSVGDEKVDPFPPSLSDGRSVDLFKLFEAVRMRGGCKRVCKKGLWDSVSVELDLGYGVKRGLKVIYMKYLNELEHRVSGILNVKGSRAAKGSTTKNLDPLNLKAVEVKSKGMECDDKLIRKEAGITQIEPDISGNSLLSEAKRYDLDSKLGEFAQKLSQHSKITQGGGAKGNSLDNDKQVVNSKSGTVNTGLGSRKRKRESVHDMLKWVTRIAKHPMKSASDINLKSNGCYAQSLLARQVLFIKGPEGGKENSLLQNNMKIQPSYYDDATYFNNQSTGILRCSKRVSSMAKSFLEGGTGQLPDPEDFNCNAKLRFESDIENVKGPHKPNHSLEDLIDTNLTSAFDISTSWIDDIPADKHTSVGPKYQAEVPEWTGLVTESDSKWLGTRMWPLEKEQNNALVSLTPVGRGRADSCSCKLPDSVTCARFHIAEKSLQLKSELGLVFYSWKFDQMGEENALSWSRKEESRFLQMVRRNPPSESKCFWDCAPRYLRKKTRYMVVSYYFNVFVLRRRSYQNRVTPSEIDSDDDDKEFEILGDTLEDEAIPIPDTDLLTCSDNKQCTE